MGRHYYGAFPFLAIIYLIAELISWSLFTAKASQVLVDEAEKNGTRWAVLVAGSNFYYNYRHQADVCHAYQILKKGGLKDENIIVFMYDDIAFNKENPRRGIIINKPNGPNVYQGVPKDYTGKHVTANNFYAVILGNKSALTGGSGKVVNSGPNDHIFIYYSDHGGPGVIEMPVGRRIYAKDLVDVLKKKHAAKAYKSMVFYLEACESGSIFDGLLPNNFSIFATTAANERELSYATYCPKDILQPSPEYGTCLGDMFSISWLEDCDKFDLSQETFERQYEAVRRRTLNSDLEESSHVMKYGDLNKLKEIVSSYMGTNPANDNFTFINDDETKHSSVSRTFSSISQRDASLLHFWHKFHKAPAGSRAKIEAQKQVLAEISRREHIDNSITQIGHLLFGYENSLKVLKNIRPQGQPLVDDWDCFKMQVNTYEKHCGRLSKYGMQYMRAFANMCNFGVTKEQLVAASIETCSYKKSSP